MRTSSLAAAMLAFACPVVANAQSAETIPAPKVSTSEIGIFGQTSFSQQNTNFSMVGVQYKKWLNEYAGIRVLGGVASYDALQPPFFIGGTQGASVEHAVNQKITLGMLGIGMEVQRQFYKRIYLFAALEVKGGYGSGSADTVVRTAYRHNESYESTLDFNAGSASASMAYLDFMPSIGAKFQFSKLTFGIEASGVMTNYTSITSGGVSTGLADFSTGGYMIHRGFISYRL